MRRHRPAAVLGSRVEGSVRVPIADAVAEPKLVVPEGELVAAARAIKTSFGDGVSST